MRFSIDKIRPQKIPSVPILLASVVAFILIFTYLSFAQHNGLKTQMNDLGNMEQPIYNTSRGKFLQTSNYIVNGTPMQINRIGVHANFIFLLFAPIYALYANPKILLFTQISLISLGSVPLYLIGKKLFKKKASLALVVPIVYLINPMVHDVALYDFHAIALAMPLLIFAFYFMFTKRYLLFYVFAIILALCKEDAVLLVFMIGLYILLIQKQKFHGTLTSLTSIFYFFLLVKIIMPQHSEGTSLYLVNQRYSYLGNTIFEVAKNLITNPQILIESLIDKLKLLYLITLLVPVLFLPLLSLEIILLSLPSLTINLLSSNVITHYPFQYYHTAPILSFIFVATIFSLNRILSIQQNTLLKKYMVHILLLTSIVFSLIFSPAPHSMISSWEEFQVSSHAKDINIIKKHIPTDKSLSVQNNLGPHFSQREKIATFPFNWSDYDYILLDINDPYYITRFSPRQRNFFFAVQMQLNKYEKSVLDIFNNENYGIEMFTEEGYLLFKKGANRDKNDKALYIAKNQLEIIKKRYVSFY